MNLISKRFLSSASAVWVVAVSALLFAVPAIAQQAAEAAVEPPGSAGILFRMSFMFLMVYMIFYFLIIKPQKQKAQEMTELMNSIKRGDTVVTSSGMIGKVAGIEKDQLLLEIAPNVKVKFESSAVTRKLSGAGASEKAA